MITVDMTSWVCVNVVEDVTVIEFVSVTVEADVVVVLKTDVTVVLSTEVTVSVDVLPSGDADDDEVDEVDGDVLVDEEDGVLLVDDADVDEELLLVEVLEDDDDVEVLDVDGVELVDDEVVELEALCVIVVLSVSVTVEDTNTVVSEVCVTVLTLESGFIVLVMSTVVVSTVDVSRCMEVTEIS